jgi:hypothetical protein
MSENRIRHLSVKKEKTISYVYYVGQVRRLPIDGKTVERTITDIVFLEKEDVYRIFISEGVMAQVWTDIPEKYKPIVEYFIQ